MAKTAKDSWCANHPHQSIKVMRGFQFLEAELLLQEAVAKVFNKMTGHRLRRYDAKFYGALSKKCGLSPRSLKQFLENGGSLQKATEILYRLGHRISKISVEKILEK